MVRERRSRRGTDELERDWWLGLGTGGGWLVSETSEWNVSVRD